MDPYKTVEGDDKKTEKLTTLALKLKTHYNESVDLRRKFEVQWTKDQKIMKGIPIYDEKSRNKIRKQPKIRFRKAWSAGVRLLASLYQAFLMDDNKFKIRGFDDVMDWMKAKVLQTMTKFRLNWMFRRRDGFTKFIWAFLDCISPGTAVVKVHWKFNEEMKIDEPCVTNYPLEQVCLDWTANLPSEMRYVLLENYLTYEQMEEMGYENLNKIANTQVPVSSLRMVRFYGTPDPLRQNDAAEGNYTDGTVGNKYPEIGNQGQVIDQVKKRYRVLECFYKKKGRIYFCVFNPDSSIFLKEPVESPYGKDVYPIAVGSLLLEAHKLIPESLVTPLAGPQEDLNMTMNLRKENQLLAMMGGWSVDKFAGVDTQALNNLRPGFIVRRNSGQGTVEPLRLPDVTQSSYVESNADQLMIDEMSGITPTKQGQTSTNKTGVAQINLQESNAKEGLFTAIVGNTLFKQVIYLLAYQIQKFETDERIFRIANAELRREHGQQISDVYDLEFDMDVEVSVGLNEVSRNALLQKQFMMIDRSLQANNATALLMKSGAQLKNPMLLNVSQMLVDIAPELGIKDTQKYMVPVQPPQPEQGQREAQVAEGQNAPQSNAADAGFEAVMQEMQGQ